MNNNYLPILEKHFPQSTYNIELEDSDGYGRDENIPIFNVRNNNSNKTCITLSIFPESNEVHVETLAKCSPKSSREQLSRAEAFVKEIGFSSVSLDDFSKLEFCNRAYRLDLSLLKLLSNGQSWYESVGYTSKENTSNREHNLRVIEKPIEEIIEYSTNTLTQHALTHSGAATILDELKSLLNVKQSGDIPTSIVSKLAKIIGRKPTTIKDTFSELIIYLQLHGNKCDDNLIFIYNILSMISFTMKHGNNNNLLIKYSRSLSKHIHKGGMRTRRRNKKNNKKSKKIKN